MAEDRVQRRLAAILAADVVGYSRMMGRDEAGTLARLKALRAEFLHPTIAEYGGRIVKTTGDGTLIEFPSAVDAVSHAVDVQRGMAERNVGLPEERQVRLRLGINVGDIIIDGEDIFGDGVNVAARLEALAEPGGICISARVHDYVRGRLDVAFDDLGERSVKNIAEKLRVYRVRLDVRPPAGTGDAASGLAEPGRPSIAVLPFDNLSTDPDQEFFADGITEDIITALSRIRQLFVIARNTTFTYKGRAADVQAVARDLGVRYVLEGSVRRAGRRVRITAQLIDGAKGNHLWAERYDRDLEDIFEVQDDITQTITAQLQLELSRAEFDRARSKPVANLDVWELHYRARALFAQRTRENVAEMRRLSERALDIDPDFALGYVWLALSYYLDLGYGFAEHDPRLFAEAARRAIELDPGEAWAHRAMGWYHLYARETERAIMECETALRLDPNDPFAHSELAAALLQIGKAEEAIPHLELAVRLSPNDPGLEPWCARLARANLVLGNYEAAVGWARKAIQVFPVWLARSYLVSALAFLGRDEEAQRALEELLADRPGLTIGYLRDHLPITHQPHLDHILDGLRKAGLAEG